MDAGREERCGVGRMARVPAGLGSNLRAMGVDPSLIAAILRHSDITTTLELYAQVQDNEAREAMQKLEARFNASNLVLNQGT